VFALALLESCSMSPNRHLLVTNREGVIERCGLDALTWSDKGGVGTASSADLARLGAVGVFKGMSGCPVVVDNEIVGAWSAVVGWYETPHFEFTSLERMHSFRPIAESLEPRHGPRIATAPLRPGELIGAFSIWGDLCLGPIGTVTYADDLLYCFAHGIDVMVGPRARALMRLRPCAVREVAGEHTITASRGAIAGVSFFDSPAASFGRSGYYPAHFRLAVTLEVCEERVCEWDFRIAWNPEYMEEVAGIHRAISPWVNNHAVLCWTKGRSDYAWIEETVAPNLNSLEHLKEDLMSALNEVVSNAAPGEEYVLCVRQSWFGTSVFS